jgi:hypothetical protein
MSNDIMAISGVNVPRTGGETRTGMAYQVASIATWMAMEFPTVGTDVLTTRTVIDQKSPPAVRAIAATGSAGKRQK